PRSVIRRFTLLTMDDGSNDLANWQSVFLRELEIALVMRRHAHHCASTVIHQHIVRDPDRQHLSIERIDGELARVDAEFLFLFRLILSLDRARGLYLFSKSVDLIF